LKYCLKIDKDIFMAGIGTIPWNRYLW